MRKFIFSLILGVFMSCLQLQAQSIQIPTIHVVEFNLDTLKHEINDSVLYYNRLKELKGQLKQEKQEVKMGLDIVKSGLKNQRDQLSLTKTKIKLLNKQIKAYEKELKNQNSEIKQINKMHNQLAKSDDVSLSSKNTQIRSLMDRKVYLEQSINATREKLNNINKDIETANGDIHRLEQLKLEIQSAQIELVRLNEACQFKQKQIDIEMKLVKSMLKK